MVSIGSCPLGEKPRVALAIQDEYTRADIDRAMTAGVHIVELRIDRFHDTTAAHVLDVLRQYDGLPRIGTIRMAREGGAWNDSETQRLALFSEILPEVDAVDIELEAVQINKKVIELAVQQGKTVIGSFHDFEKTPAPDVFQSLLQTAKDLGVTIIKFAAQCSCREDIRQLACLLVTHPETNMIVLGMGSQGRVTRFLFPALGSLITYTFLGNPSAPGQATLEDTIHLLDLLYENNK